MNLIRREPGPSLVIGFIIFLIIFNVAYVALTDYTASDWWANFWEG